MESEMYEPIGDFLRNRGSELVVFEVPQRRGSARRIDVAGTTKIGESVTSVEAKIGHFNRAFEQASQRLFISDFVYVSFQEEYAHSVMSSRLQNLHSSGIGLISVNETATELVPPSPSAFVDPLRRKRFVEMLWSMV